MRTPQGSRVLLIDWRAMRAGFTMVEILFVTLVIAILAVVAVPSYKTFVAKGHRDQAKAQLTALASAIESSYYNAGTYKDLIASGTWEQTNRDYTFSVVVADDDKFEVKAVLTADPSARCGTLSVNSWGVPEPSACW